MKRNLLFFVLVTLTACKTPTEKWLGGLEEFREIKSGSLSMQALRVRPATDDTTELSYKVRIYPSKSWLANNHSTESTGNFYYRMDSAFTMKYGSQTMRPQLVQPVANGLSNCFEYLISMEITPGIKMKHISILYQDKFIDGKQYTMDLNRQ